MPGRHEAPGLASYYRQLALFLVGLAVAGVVVIGGAAWLVRGGGGAQDRVGIGSATTVATSMTSTTLTTVLSEATPSTTATDDTSTTSSSTTTTLRAPDEVTVVVLNATDRTGLAATVSGRIEAAGYRTDPPGNHGKRLDRSRVWYREGFRAEALDLAARFVPDAVVEPYPFGEAPADIVVVLGASFEG